MAALRKLFWTWFGLGLSPVAPGTMGTLGGVLIGAAALLLPAGLPAQLALAGAAVAIATAAILLGGAAEVHHGRRDPGSFVIDEVAGYLVALLLLPLHERPWLVLGAAFVLFRAADILKPWPVSAAERLPGGVGIVADDLVAGVYANLAAWGLLALV